MKLHNYISSIVLFFFIIADPIVASDRFNNLFFLRKNLDAACGEAKWLVQYTVTDRKVDIIGYCKMESRIFKASGILNPGMNVTANIGIESFNLLKVTISDSGGLVKNADLFRGECVSVFLTYEYYHGLLDSLQKHHFEVGLENCPRKYLLIEGDPEILMAADQMEPEVPKSHEYLRDRKPPIMGFGYNHDENGRLHIDEILEGTVADHAGLKAGDLVTQIFLDYTLVDPKLFKVEMSKKNQTILRFVVIRENKPQVVDMYFPSMLERRIMAVPPKDGNE
jgi:hypothetical protein